MHAAIPRRPFARPGLRWLRCSVNWQLLRLVLLPAAHRGRNGGALWLGRGLHDGARRRRDPGLASAFCRATHVESHFDARLPVRRLRRTFGRTALAWRIPALAVRVCRFQLQQGRVRCRGGRIHVVSHIGKKISLSVRSADGASAGRPGRRIQCFKSRRDTVHSPQTRARHIPPRHELCKQCSQLNAFGTPEHAGPFYRPR